MEDSDADAAGESPDSRQLLDENGRLFGLVNVVDALVVLLVLAVGVAGVALLFSPTTGEADNRYVTLDLGPQPDFIAEEITPGDEWEPEQTSDSITITDVYRYNANGETNVIARAEVNGTLFEPEEPDERPTFEFRGEQLRLGQTFELLTEDYETTADVTRIEQSGETLPVSDSEFVVETTVSSETAAELEVGDEFTAGGDSFGEITGLELFPGEEGQYALVGISARTLERGGSQFLGDTRIGIGTTLSFAGDGYDFSGEVVNRGTSTIDTEDREFVLQTEVPVTVADDIRSGDEFRIGDVPIVTVEEVTVYATDDSEVRRVALGVTALTRVEDGSIFFGDRQLRIGDSLPVETDEYDIDGEVVRRGSLDEAGTPGTQRVTLQLENIPPERVETLSEGMTERTRDQTTATVQNMATESADVVLESEDGDIFLREHPKNKDVELTVDLSVRELDDGTVRFRGDTLRVGDTLALELGPVTVEGTVINFQ